MAEGLYVHVPFCTSRCAYCGLPSTAGQLHLLDSYLDCVVEEAAACRDDRIFDTVFLGGGTPSVLGPERLKRLFDQVIGQVRLTPDVEITVEVNPESFHDEVAAVLRSLGVTRISLGVQSMVDDDVSSLGRRHRVEDVHKAVNLLRHYGYPSWSVDLIAGWPGHELVSWQRTLDAVTEISPDHVSVYLWHREQGTRFHEALCSGDVEPPDDELVVAMYYRAKDLFERRGLEHYEISSFARPNHRCRHNLRYWLGGSYCGLGAGASSFLQGRRSTNVRSPQQYIERMRAGKSPVADEESLGSEAAWRESLMLALRVLRPVVLDELSPLPAEHIMNEVRGVLRECVSEGLVDDVGSGFVLSRRGLVLANEVMARVV